MASESKNVSGVFISWLVSSSLLFLVLLLFDMKSTSFL